MDFTTFLWTTFGAFLTLAIFSFLYKDNPFYKIAEHLVVGVSTGYFAMLLWHQGLIQKLWFNRLEDGSWYLLWADSSRPEYLIPAFLGILMWTRFSKKYVWVSRYPLALYIGISAGLAVPQEMYARVNQQLFATMAKIHWGAFFGTGGFHPLDVGSGFSQMLIFVGVISALIYFFFSKAHTGVFGGVAKFGIGILMIGFGASFGFTVMARISLFINRIQFMDFTWGRTAFNATGEPIPNYNVAYPIMFWLLVLLVVGYTAFEIISHFKGKGEKPE
jgi:hypothetical protein